MSHPQTNIINFSAVAAQAQVLPSPMPTLFRLLNVTHHQVKATHCQYSATLYNEACTIRVCWSRYRPDSRLKDGLLVSPRGLELSNHSGWAYKISGLSVRTMPSPDENLFHTIPASWVDDREVVQQAAALSDALSKPYRHLFNAIFWDGERFRRFCIGPSSMQNHHAEINGNLRHCVETARRLQRDCADLADLLDPGFCILLGLLHDAGKADEYQLSSNGQWIMTDRGSLLGHKVTITEWIAIAKDVHGVDLHEDSYLALQHCLNSAQNAPQWLGVRESVMLEAFLLSGHDRTSGKLDMFRRLAPPANRGWGCRHVHMKYRPYFLGVAPAENVGQSLQTSNL